MNKQRKDKQLIEAIEDTRIQLNKLISNQQYNLLDPKVVALSQLLDNLLSQYYDFKK